MKIGIISDTHDSQEGIDRAFEIFKDKQVSSVIHAGDWVKPSSLIHLISKAVQLKWPVYGVLGNNDNQAELFNSNFPTEIPVMIEDILELELDGVRIGVVHGHRPTLIRMLGETADVVVRGHSHKALIAEQEGYLLLNPGSAAYALPRTRDDQRSVAVFDTETKAAEIVWFSRYFK